MSTGADAQELVERALEAVRAAGADAADAVYIENDSLEVRVRGDEIDFVTQAREHTLGLRALVAGGDGFRSALTSTSDLSVEAVARAAEEAAALAGATAIDAAAGLPAEGFAVEVPDLRIVSPEDRAVSADDRLRDAFAAEGAARATDPRITNSEGSQAESGFSRVAYGNSRGFFGEYASASHSLFAQPLAAANGSMQRDYWMTVSRHLGQLEDPASVGRCAARRALRRLGAVPVPTCEVPVIFDPVTAPSLLAHLASCVNGYSVYRETSYLAGRLGDAVASDLVTVVDDGQRPGGLGSKPFDGEGLPTRRNVVVDRGRLATYLLDSYSARKLGGQSTGNASRGVASPPTASPTNLWLEPGKGDLDDIVAGTDRGLLVTELIGMGFNPVSGDYSRGAAGLWIEGGEITHPVEEVTIAGNLADMLADIDAVGSDLIWLGRIASPSVRIARMTLAGADR
ncbi:MAG: TldD/PmbA family protein [Myxococcota bacterium]